MDPTQMAQGGGGMPPQGGPPTPPQQPTSNGQPMVEPGGGVQGVDLEKIKEALSQIIPQCLTKERYVDFNQLVALWPQVAQQMGLNVPFQTVWQIIENNPSLVQDLMIRLGLAGLKANGRMYSAEQLSGMGNGSVPQQPAQGGM